MKRSMTPLGLHRVKMLGWEQDQMAAILRTSQPEVSRTENGEPPPNKREIARWARAYKLSKKAFLRMCDGALEVKRQIEIEKWELPLWKYSEAKTPAEVEVIECRQKHLTNCA